MKKYVQIAALAASATALPALAQSSVTLFGIADGGINYVSGQNGSNTRLASGIMEGSRWGLRGNEDMGGGWRTLFVLESRFELDTGDNFNRPASGTQVPDRLRFTTAGLGLPLSPVLQGAIDNVAANIGNSIGVNLERRPFDRQAFVALVTPVGAVVAGRQYTPGYEMFYVFDAMQTDSSLSSAQVATVPIAIDIRRDNSLAYRVEKNGFTGTLTYSFGEQISSSSNSRYLGANFYYKGPSWGSGVAYAINRNSAGETALRNFLVGAYADIGPGRLSALFATAKDDNPDALVAIRAALVPLGGAGVVIGNAFEAQLSQDARIYHLGYRITRGMHTVTVAYNHLNDRLHADTDISSYGMAYTYALSKRTDLNLVLTRFANDRNAQTAPGGGGFFGGVTSEGGQDAHNIAFGIRHRF